MNKQIAILLCLLVQIAGCATLDIKADVPPANNPSTPRRMNRLFWGMVNNKIPVADPIYPANGIQDVCYHESAGQVLVTILTVGVYSPIDYRYTLALSPYPNARHTISKNGTPARRQVFDTTASCLHYRKFYSRAFTHDTVASRRVVYHRFLWGALNKNNVVPNSKESGGLQCLGIRVNIWEGLASVVSLGLYCPVTYRYRFAYLDDEY